MLESASGQPGQRNVQRDVTCERDERAVSEAGRGGAGRGRVVVGW